MNLSFIFSGESSTNPHIHVHIYIYILSTCSILNTTEESNVKCIENSELCTFEAVIVYKAALLGKLIIFANLSV